MKNTYKLIDTHAHLNFDNFKNSLDEIIDNAKQAGVEKIIIPGVTLQDTPEIIKITEKYSNVFGAVAVHPSESKDWKDEYYDEIKKYACHEKIVAIGETGLDYYWDKSFANKQKYVFREHLKLAKEMNLPVIVHDREAHADILEILKEFLPRSGSEQLIPQVKTIMHCFSGDVEFAFECMEIGCYIAIGGPVTFKNAKNIKEVAQKVPLEKLLIETDAPFLAPHPFRGKQNEPLKIKFIAEEIAKIKGISFEEIANTTSQNAEKIYNI